MPPIEPVDDETIAYRILDDRRNRRFVKTEHPVGYFDLEAAVSSLHPGYVAIREYGSDPILLDRHDAAQLIQVVALAFDARPEDFPIVPRTCENCEQPEHTVESCEYAEWDPTPNGAIIGE